MFDEERLALLLEMKRLVQDKVFIKQQLKQAKVSSTDDDTSWETQKQRYQHDLLTELDKASSLLQREKASRLAEEEKSSTAQLQVNELTREVKRLRQTNQNLQQDEQQTRIECSELREKNKSLRAQIGLTETDREELQLAQNKLRILSQFVQTKELEHEQREHELEQLKIANGELRSQLQEYRLKEGNLDDNDDTQTESHS